MIRRAPARAERARSIDLTPPDGTAVSRRVAARWRCTTTHRGIQIDDLHG
jgi:hypothetical protein